MITRITPGQTHLGAGHESAGDPWGRKYRRKKILWFNHDFTMGKASVYEVGGGWITLIATLGFFPKVLKISFSSVQEGPRQATTAHGTFSHIPYQWVPGTLFTLDELPVSGLRSEGTEQGRMSAEEEEVVVGSMKTEGWHNQSSGVSLSTCNLSNF